MESSHCGAGFFAVWSLAGGFLPLCLPATCRKKPKSAGLCLQKQPVMTCGAAGRREKLETRCGMKGSPSLLCSGVHTRQILSCCCGQWVWQLPVGCWGKAPHSYLPFHLLGGWTGQCMALGLSPARGSLGWFMVFSCKDFTSCEMRKLWS